jgi:hypothetical protein
MADGKLGYRGTLSDEYGNPIPFKTVDLGDGTFALATAVPAAGGGVAVTGPLTDAQLAARLPLEVDQAPGTPAVSIVTLTLANTEYSASISAGAFEFRARTAVAVRFAFATGKVAGSTDPYATLNAGECFYAEGVADCTLYLASSSAGTVVEVINYAV